jgi:uncharacterized membrane protein YfcA
MPTLILYLFAGFGAQLVDGALGMAFGVTSTTLLLAGGLSPAVASASVHLSELGTTLASGAAHWKFQNVDWRLVLRLGVPGAVGAFVGATLLSSISAEAAAPWTAGILLALGVYILIRFSTRPPSTPRDDAQPHGKKMLAPLGFVAGFIDATGGGGWGPVSTSTLLSTGRTAPRKVIGSVATSEFLVALAASVGFIVGLGAKAVDAAVVGGLLIGGVLAAPIAAWLVRHLPPAVLGVGVGGLLVLTNLRLIFNALDVTGGQRATAYAVISVAWAIAVAASVRRVRRERAEALVAAPVVPEQVVEDDEREREPVLA